jgi:hypothetical protein
LLGQAVERDPRYGHALAQTALCHHQLLDAGEGETHRGPAVDFARRAAKRVGSMGGAPNFTTSLRFLAACYAHLGRLGEAREIVRRLCAITPIVMEPAMRYRNPELRELFLSGLRMAAGETG